MFRFILFLYAPPADEVGSLRQTVGRPSHFVDNVALTDTNHLGSNDAWDKIPSDERGLFLTDEGTLFRGFLLPPELIDPDNYEPRPRADQDTTNDEEGGNQ